MICTKCGSTIAENALFCTFCGQPTGLSAPAQSAPVMQEVPQSIPVMQEVPQSAPITQEAPQSVPLMQEAPQSIPVMQEVPQSVPVMQEVPQSIPVMQETPQSAPVQPVPAQPAAAVPPMNAYAQSAAEPQSATNRQSGAYVPAEPPAIDQKPEKYYTFGHIALCLAAVAVMAIIAGVFAGLYFSVV